MKKPKPAYTKAELAKWNADMLFKQPVTRPQEGLVPGVNALSFLIGASANGAYLLINDGHGDRPMPILINPVVAAALRDGLDHVGRTAGWLDNDGAVVVPDQDK